MSKVNINWEELGFDYIKTDLRYVSIWENGKWDDGKLVEDNKLVIEEGAPALHYGQQCFEGLKAYRTKNGDIQLFRPDKNAERLNNSCKRLLMPEVPVEKFIDACMQVVKANEDFVPPYGTGATLYLRPFLIGVGDNIGLKPASKFIFSVFCIPVGPYFKGGMKPVNFIISDYDRAAPNGTGAQKVGGNYAGSLIAQKIAKENGYADAIFLDPATHTKIEEVGSANFFGITKDNKFVTPLSPSILPSITKYSLLEIARDYFNMEVIEGDVYINKIDDFKEAGACGTAAVITPIGGIQFNDKLHVFYDEKEVGPITKKLYDTLVGIQFGDIEAPKGWIYKVK
ncbi:MAG: branched-chain amino acid aminotransferase [Clostridium baratii]|uniref:Branched-chain-amino-acid aminotransferase n=1 Tax=Clostridium baratii str. Sullivan TaxID=1415775 RepID=A0A0A7FWN0_9CLOT|nr:branched-chain amino acid aminotransferase [Clostridium baratii]AIY83236.1 branched-chain amino acid aminotransferase [Clostridium baratii str. Sullivan]MBS6006782.1 branched-chain amino acid aminotransferase [Clostridium baratii]MDU1053545.1 branched-chain amino acid aminotransferase [Clostridium baratii]MDU4910411.1 branched-chain amino acid aminotransferase [Clostridium baratii]CUP01367.1 branched-chain amino acid aminotransferase [Clostridium baratii]